MQIKNSNSTDTRHTLRGLKVTELAEVLPADSYSSHLSFKTTKPLMIQNFEPLGNLTVTVERLQVHFCCEGIYGVDSFKQPLKDLQFFSYFPVLHHSSPLRWLLLFAMSHVCSRSFPAAVYVRNVTTIPDSFQFKGYSMV